MEKKCGEDEEKKKETIILSRVKDVKIPDLQEFLSFLSLLLKRKL